MEKQLDQSSALLQLLQLQLLQSFGARTEAPQLTDSCLTNLISFYDRNPGVETG